MRVDINQLSEVHFTATADSGHEIHMDGPADLGGNNQGTRPMELLLMGLGGCAATDIVHILKKSRQNLRRCQVSIDAERASEDPKVLTKIHLCFHLYGDSLDLKKVQRAALLSAEKYCSASILMRRAGVIVTHEVNLVAD